MTLNDAYKHNASANDKSRTILIPAPMDNKQTVNASADVVNKARDSFITTLIEKVNDFAILDKSIIASDIQHFQSCDESDRHICFDRLTFCLLNFAILEFYLVDVPGFRQFFIDTINQELAIDNFSETDRKSFRKMLCVDGCYDGGSFYVYGKNKTTPECYALFDQLLQGSYELSGLDTEALISDARNLPENVRKELGIICSHFGYILRAIALNDRFIITCAAAVQHFLDPKSI